MDEKIISTKGLTFDDVLVVPNYTQVKREETDLSVSLNDKIKLSIPFLTSPMDTVTGWEMAAAIGKLGGLGIIHRNSTTEKQVEEVVKAKKETEFVGAAVGTGRDFEERVKSLVDSGVDVLVVDSAHGHSKFIIDAVRHIAGNYKNIYLIAGNVATEEGIKALIEAGAKAVRVGMGPGSICTTRIIAGIGIPQITAIMETAKAAKEFDVKIIADGGIRTSGDMVKAFVAGAHFIMAGSLFAGCSEALGEVVEIEGKKFKSYRGMGSVEAMKEGSAARYGQEYRKGQERKLIAEGVKGLVSYKGSLEDVVFQMIGGIRTGMYYTGTKNLKELRENTKFIRITKASMVESHPHDIVV